MPNFEEMPKKNIVRALRRGGLSFQDAVPKWEIVAIMNHNLRDKRVHDSLVAEYASYKQEKAEKEQKRQGFSALRNSVWYKCECGHASREAFKVCPNCGERQA